MHRPLQWQRGETRASGAQTRAVAAAVLLTSALWACAGAGARGEEVPIYDVTADRSPVPCLRERAHSLVLVPFGQSNAGSQGESAHKPAGDVINFNWADGRCYLAEDPLLGAAGARGRGSIWTRLADKLQRNGLFERIVIAPIAVDGSHVAEWVPEGKLWPRLPAVVQGLRANGLEPDMFLWVQGEADASVTADPDAYKRDFLAMAAGIREIVGSRAPIFIAVATLCYGQDTGPVLEHVEPETRAAKWMGQEAIQQAQRQLVDPARGLYPGPDLDFIGTPARWDGCHLSTYGLDVAADLWKQRLLAPR